MDFNLIRLDIEKELTECNFRIQLVLNTVVDRDEASRRKMYLFVNSIYQAIGSDIKRGRKMITKWTTDGMLVLSIESIRDVEHRERMRS